MYKSIFSEVDTYISELLAPEDDALKKVIHSLGEHGLPQASVSANQGKFIQMMAMSCNASKILELGTLGGYSTIWLARALPENGQLISLEFDKMHAEVARKNIERAGLSNKVEVRVGKALEHLEQMVSQNEGPFDLIFIDADKPPYTEYFQLALKLSRKGSIIIADNVIRDGKVLDPYTSDEKVQGVQRFNRFLSTSPDVSATILQMVGIKEYDGMAIAIVK
jgi:predicted O-methyltransferase YrrM